MDREDLSTTEPSSRMVKGDREAEALVYPRVSSDLRRRAEQLMRNQKPGHLLQATALVNEAWLKTAGRQTDWEDRAQFLKTADRAMRCVLVDHARARAAVKWVCPAPAASVGVRRLPTTVGPTNDRSMTHAATGPASPLATCHESS